MAHGDANEYTIRDMPGKMQAYRWHQSGYRSLILVVVSQPARSSSPISHTSVTGQRAGRKLVEKPLPIETHHYRVSTVALLLLN